MKNIHLIPTEKPSRLCMDSKDILWFSPRSGYSTADGKQHIYITSNEEIKEGDWHLVWLRDKWEVLNYMPSIGYRKECLGKGVCKIILTTDQDLIKDGVQAVNDEFLEWFVNNPSCEEVEVTYEVLNPFQSIDKGYVLRLPDNEVLEEPKQENTLKELLLQLRNTPMTFVPKEEQKQHLIDMMKGDEELGLYKEPKQETLEEAAEKESEVQGWGKYESNSEQYAIKQSFIRGTEWQAERMYSEEDLLNAFEAGMMFIGEDKGSFKEWFEQFKKK